VKVLYIHSVPQFGGASRSLYELVRALRVMDVTPCFVASKGSAQVFFEKVAADGVYPSRISAFNNTRTGFYSGARWLVVLREIFSLPRTILSFRRAKRKFGSVDVIHVNEVIDLPSAIAARYFFDAPIIFHLRTSFRNRPDSWRSRVILAALRKYASAIIAIDKNTRSTLPEYLPINVVHNSLHLDENAFARNNVERNRRGTLVVGYVGNLLHSKGIMTLLRAIALLKKQGKDVRLDIVGGGILQRKGVKAHLINLLGVSDDASEEVVRIIEKEGIQDCVTRHGHIDDITSVYRSFDILAFPSILDAPGRPIFEAGLFGIPSIACISRPQDDTFVDGESGLTVPPGDPEKLAAAIDHFYGDREEVERMGRNARDLARKNTNPIVNARHVLKIYGQICLAYEGNKKEGIA